MFRAADGRQATRQTLARGGFPASVWWGESSPAAPGTNHPPVVLRVETGWSGSILGARLSEKVVPLGAVRLGLPVSEERRARVGLFMCQLLLWTFKSSAAPETDRGTSEQNV